MLQGLSLGLSLIPATTLPAAAPVVVVPTTSIASKSTTPTLVTTLVTTLTNVLVLVECLVLNTALILWVKSWRTALRKVIPLIAEVVGIVWHRSNVRRRGRKWSAVVRWGWRRYASRKAARRLEWHWQRRWRERLHGELSWKLVRHRREWRRNERRLCSLREVRCEVLGRIAHVLALAWTALTVSVWPLNARLRLCPLHLPGWWPPAIIVAAVESSIAVTATPVLRTR